MINSHAAEAIRQQHRDALLSQADSSSPGPFGSPRASGPDHAVPESSPESAAEPTRVRRLVRRLAWGTR